MEKDSFAEIYVSRIPLSGIWNRIKGILETPSQKVGFDDVANKRITQTLVLRLEPRFVRFTMLN